MLLPVAVVMADHFNWRPNAHTHTSASHNNAKNFSYQQPTSQHIEVREKQFLCWVFFFFIHSLWWSKHKQRTIFQDHQTCKQLFFFSRSHLMTKMKQSIFVWEIFVYFSLYCVVCSKMKMKIEIGIGRKGKKCGLKRCGVMTRRASVWTAVAKKACVLCKRRQKP